MDETIGEGFTLGISDIDNVDVFRLLSAPDAVEEDSSVDEEELKDGKTLLWSMALGLKGCMPHFANPALMFNMENAFSKGFLTTRANSRFDTTKSFFANDKALLKCDFNDLKTDTSKG